MNGRCRAARTADAASSRQLPWTAHLEMARLLEMKGKTAEAKAALQRAIATVEDGRATLQTAENRTAFLHFER